MEIVHIAAECTPLAKAGGLGDVMLGLSRALKQKGHSVEILLPKYDLLNLKEIEDLHVLVEDLPCFFEGKSYSNRVWQGKMKGMVLTLIESFSPFHFFNRGKIYGEIDDVDRFLYFSRAALEYLTHTKRSIDVVHLHDWHAAGVAPLYRTFFERTRLNCPKLVFTFHNLAYQGRCDALALAKVGLKEEDVLALKEESGEGYNILRGGIVLSDFVTTVSPTYAKEVHENLSFGLEIALGEQNGHFRGILNGIDYDFWNPEKDPLLKATYSVNELKEKAPFLKGKSENKEALKRFFSLDRNEKPLVAAITRLVPQKGTEMIRACLLHTLEKGAQFILVGSTDYEKAKEEFWKLKEELKNNPNCHLELTYDEKLSHEVYAAADLFLVPSHFEPCGLTQMIAMHYGAVPIVRRTGGLADTVKEGVNGFAFDEISEEAAVEALDRALALYRSSPSQWAKLIQQGMTQDFSWRGPAEEYLMLYKDLCIT